MCPQGHLLPNWVCGEKWFWVWFSVTFVAHGAPEARRGFVIWCGMVWFIGLGFLSAFVAHEARRGVRDSGFVVENGPQPWPVFFIAPRRLAKARTMPPQLASAAKAASAATGNEVADFMALRRADSDGTLLGKWEALINLSWPDFRVRASEYFAKV